MPTAMFYKTQEELNDAVDKIFNLGPKERFNSWKEAVKAISGELVVLQPDGADIAGHPWLMKVECQFNVILTGQTLQSLPSTSQPATPMVTCMVKEKGRATDVGAKVQTGWERLAGAMDDNGESEVEDMDQLMDDDDDEKHRPWG
ncbi:hypothetical protein EDD15DRAFT_2199742 [Pisolithus albus]|nr:hypothetical protein EDD15DRAFT_2199742 [Pisolithus albus]